MMITFAFSITIVLRKSAKKLFIVEHIATVGVGRFSDGGESWQSCLLKC